MASILAKLRTYNGKWNVASKEAFDAADIASIQSNEVVPSEYGLSVKLNRVGGQTSFIPVSNTSTVCPGDVFHLSTVYTLPVYVVNSLWFILKSWFISRLGLL